MKPFEFLAFSLKVLQNDRSAAGARSAISRAYYAAFQAAKDFIQGMSVARLSDGPGAHGEVRNHLVQTGDQQIDEVGLNLATLHGERIAADYRLDRQNAEKAEVADELVNLASVVIAEINKCLADKQRYATVSHSVRQRTQKLQGRSSP